MISYTDVVQTFYLFIYLYLLIVKFKIYEYSTISTSDLKSLKVIVLPICNLGRS